MKLRSLGLDRFRRQARRAGTKTKATSDESSGGGLAGANPSGYVAPKSKDTDLDSNLAWNRERWGQEAGWSELDQFGYRWSGGHQQTTAGIAQLADKHLRPFLGDRYDLDIVELSPGAGRFTVELLRYASNLSLVDINQAAINVCRERLRYYPTPIEFYVNDGRGLPMVEDASTDLVACYDSMVHMHPDVVIGYVREAARTLRSGGIAWLDHSGKGPRNSGHRTAMTAELMADFAVEAGFSVVDQRWRNDWDCISVLSK